MRGMRYIILSILVLFVSHHVVYAGYVLPYPSFMPGNKAYKISRLLDQGNFYWYFGNIAKCKYYLGLSDKYLVEAKTLFEYGQYLLASDALQRSDKAIINTVSYLYLAEKEGKNMTNQRNVFGEAMDVHIKTMEKLIAEVPSEFQWSPEKDKPTELKIGQMLRSSIQIRKDAAFDIKRKSY